MLSVSTAWKNMFKTNLVGEALIKFVVEDYGTLYKGDIFSYTFDGNVSAVSNGYPEYNAKIELVMRADYLNFSNFLGKSVEIYYGFIVSGSDEYVKALTLYIDDIEVSDDGRICTWYLKSIFAYMTDTISILLDKSAPYYALSDFCTAQLGSYSYNLTGSRDFDYRTFPSRITLGEALQELCFVNTKTLYVDSANTIQMKEIDFDDYSTFVDFNEINLTAYPHITKPDIISNVNVDYVDENSIDLNIVNVMEENIALQSQGGGQNPRYDLSTYYENGDVYILQAYCWIDNSNISFNINTFKNDYLEARFYASNVYSGNFYLRGVSYQNYATTQDGVFKVFDINITTLGQQQAITNWLSEYLAGDQQIELKCRLDPSFELMDRVFTDHCKRFIIESLKITFKGSYQGTIKGRYWGDTFVAPVVSNYQYTKGGLFGDEVNYKVENNNNFSIPYPSIMYYTNDGEKWERKAFAIYPLNPNASYTINENTGMSAYSTKLMTYATQKYNGELTKNIYVAFLYGHGGRESDKVLLIARDIIPNAPELLGWYVNEGVDFEFEVYNPTNEDLTLVVVCSNGSHNFTISAHGTLILNYDNASFLEDSCQMWGWDSLEEDVYCYLKDENNAVSDNVLLLEANE